MADNDPKKMISRENDQRLGRSGASDTVTLTDANTEYTWDAPSGTKKIILKLRTFDADFSWGFATGELNLTVIAGTTGIIDGVYLVDQTLYFSCTTAGKVVEILYFT